MRKRLFLQLGLLSCAGLVFLGIFYTTISTLTSGENECLLITDYSPRTRHVQFVVKRKFESKVRHIAFLKVHKTGSTTVQGLFLRFGWEYNLTFILLKFEEPYKNTYPNIISLDKSVSDDNVIPPPVNKTFDLLCCHVIFNRTAFQNILPRDAVFIGIVREPFDQFKSMVHYFRPTEVVSIKSKFPVLEFLRHPEIYSVDTFTNNRMAFEFGFPTELFQTYNQSVILKYLRELDEAFRVVLIFEHLHESLLLMRRILKWDLKDILYVKKNIRQQPYSFQAETEEHELYRKWARIDYSLYDFFYRRLWKQISEEDDFYEELLFYKRMQQKVEGYCILLGKRPKRLVFAASKWNDKFVITQEHCMDMSLDEISFINRIRRKQYRSR